MGINKMTKEHKEKEEPQDKWKILKNWCIEARDNADKKVTESLHDLYGYECTHADGEYGAFCEVIKKIEEIEQGDEE